MIKEVILKKPQMKSFAKKISALLLEKEMHLALNGTLGAGKTFLIREIIKNITKDPSINITSPTFNIVNIYNKSGQKSIYHFDLYRIESETELENIGFFEAFQIGICLVEWPSIAKKYLKNTIFIDILKEEENKRKFIIHAGSK